jgi:hypothetical protein
MPLMMATLLAPFTVVALPYLGFLALTASLAAAGGAAIAWRRSLALFSDVRWAPVLVSSPPPQARERPPPAPRRRPASSVSVLGRVEARELATSVWFAVAYATLLIFVAAISRELGHWDRSWWSFATELVMMVHPFCAFTIVAVHRAVSRAGRDGLEELYESCPVERVGRTRAQLRAGWVAVVAAGIFALVLTTIIAIFGAAYGPFDGRFAADVVVVPVLAAGAVALAVALGRWVPWALAPVLAVAGIALLEQGLFDLGHDGGKLRGLTPAGFWPESDPLYQAPRPVGRLAWLAGLTLAVGALALVRSRSGWRRAPLTALVIGLAVSLSGVVAVIRPLSDATVDRLEAYVSNSGRYQVCYELSPDVRVCMPEPYADLGRRYSRELAPMAEALPESAFDRQVTMRPRFGGPWEPLPAEVKDRFALRFTLSADAVEIGLQHTDFDFAQARFRLAAAAVEGSTDLTTTTIRVAGESSGLVVLWYATRGLSADAADATLTPEIPAGVRVTDSMRGDVWPTDVCGQHRGMLWSRQDLAAARALLTLPDEHVNRVLAAGWSHWIDPLTPTDDLLAALDLPPVGRPDHVELYDTKGC